MEKPEIWLEEMRLKDGRLVRFRSVRPEDEHLITEAIHTSSRETLLHRFFSPIRGVPPDLLRRMLAIDSVKESCIVGVVENGVKRIICGARYVRLEKEGAAEIAVTVHDDFQGRGLGTYVLRIILRLALEEGIRWFEADVMASNSKMLHLFRKVFPKFEMSHREGDIYHLVAELEF